MPVNLLNQLASIMGATLGSVHTHLQVWPILWSELRCCHCSAAAVSCLYLGKGGRAVLRSCMPMIQMISGHV